MVDFETIKYSSPMDRDIMGTIRMYGQPMYGCGIYPGTFGSIYGQNPMRMAAQRDEFVNDQKEMNSDKKKSAVKTGLIAGALLLAAGLICKKTNLLKTPAAQKIIGNVKTFLQKAKDKAKPLFTDIVDKVKPFVEKAKDGIVKIFNKIKSFFK